MDSHQRGARNLGIDCAFSIPCVKVNPPLIKCLLKGRLDIELLQNITIAPTQTRIVPIKINQTLAYGGTYLPITLHLVSREHNTKKVVHTRISVRQLPHWSPSEVPTDGIKATYFYGSSTPTTFVVKPPDEPNEGPPKPPILALRSFLICLRRL